MKIKSPAPAPAGPAAGPAHILVGVSACLLGEVDLEPNPKDLMLRNHA